MTQRMQHLGWGLAAALAVALLVVLVLLPRPAGPPATGARGAPAAPAVTGPDLPATRAALDRTITWLSETRVRPEQEGLGRFRFYVMEVRCWYLLHAFAREAAAREQFRRATIERLELLGDGQPLATFLRGARMHSLIADLLILVVMAQDLGVRLPALEAALPELYRLGQGEPQRPIGLAIALTHLAEEAGLQPSPTLAELRPRGMLSQRPREATMKVRDVYYLTHEVFGLTDYGLARGTFDASEQAYLERSLPFWSLLHVILNMPDPAAEIATCHQVTGTAGSHGYGENLRNLIEIQSPAGTFGDSRVESELPIDIRLGYLHTTMVALHALLGHEALLTTGRLPGRPAR